MFLAVKQVSPTKNMPKGLGAEKKGAGETADNKKSNNWLLIVSELGSSDESLSENLTFDPS